ncbi:MAG: nucleotidyltransferase family protein [bacterium]|nr:nucleotidyltransferase family protein [bacterium]
MSWIEPGPGEFSPEMCLLLSLCRMHLNGTGADGIQGVSPEEINWQTFLERTGYHRVLPVVYPALNARGFQGVPPNVVKTLNRRFENHKIRSLDIMAELVRLLKLFERNRVPVICLKGPVLSLQLYGNLFARHHGDIDLLGTPGDIGSVHTLMLEAGYENQSPEHGEAIDSPRHLAALMKSVQHINYIHPEKKVRLEFHYRLFKNPYLFPYDPKEALENARIIDYNGTALKMLDPVDDILYLFAHGSNHRWFRLKWLMDIGRWSLSPAPESQRLVRRCLELRLERIVAQGLLLSNQLLGTPLTEFFKQMPVKKRPMGKLIRYALNEINKPMNRESKTVKTKGFRIKSYMMKLKKGFRYKMFHLIMLFYTDANRRILKLPAPLFPLYFILNPFLWFYRKFIRKSL